MKVRCIYSFPWFWRSYRAFVLYPFILFKEDKSKVSEKLFRHEWEHVRQVRTLGWFKFYYRWLRETRRVGYLDNKFEKAARAAENTPLSAKERQVFHLGKEP